MNMKTIKSQKILHQYLHFAQSVLLIKAEIQKVVIYIYTHIHTYTYCIYIHTVYTYIHILYIHIYIHTHTYIHTYTYIYIYIYTYIHIHIYTRLGRYHYFHTVIPFWHHTAVYGIWRYDSSAGEGGVLARAVTKA